MKQFLAAILLIAVVSANALISTMSYTENHQYRYLYRAITTSGIPMNTNERSGIYFNCQVLLQVFARNQFLIQLVEPVIRHISMDDVNETLDIDRVYTLDEIKNMPSFQALPREIEEHITQHLKVPISFVLNQISLQIEDIQTAPNEPEWITNIKLGIVQQFQAQFHTSPKTTVENTILGEQCQVHHTPVALKTNGHWKMTRQINMNNCQRPVVFRDIIGLNGERTQPQEDLVRGTMTSRLTVDVTNGKLSFIRAATTEGRFMVRAYDSNKGELITMTRQELIFQDDKQTQLNSIQIPKLAKKSSTLSLSLSTNTSKVVSSVYDEIMPESDKINMIVRLLKEIESSVILSKIPDFKIKHTEKYMYATKLMRTLKDSKSFETLTTIIANDQRSHTLRSMYVNALSFCGSPALVESLPKLQIQLTPLELKTLLTVLPATLSPTQQSILTLTQMFQECKDESTARQLLLSIGANIHNLCKPKYDGQAQRIDVCDDTFQQQIKMFFEDSFKSKSDERFKLVVIKAIGNSGLDMFRFLKPLIHGTSMPKEIRVNAIYALRRCQDTEQIVNTLLPVYYNEKSLFDIEMRLAAFNILLESHPEVSLFTELVSFVNFDHDSQLSSYVHTYLTNMLKHPDLYIPTHNLTIAAQSLLPTIRNIQSGLLYSQNIQFITQSESRRFAHLLEMNTIMTHEQALPRTANLRLIQSLCGYYTELLELGFRMEGLDTIIREASLAIDNSLEAVEQVLTGSFRQQISIIRSMLQDKIVPKELETAHGYLFIKYLGHELGVIDSHDVMDTIQNVDWQDKLYTLLNTLQSDIQYITMIPLSQGTIRVQTPMGIPFNADYHLVSMVSLSSKDPEDTQESLLSRAIVPRITIVATTSIGCDLGLFKPTIGHQMLATVNMPLKLHLKQDQNDRVSLEIYLDDVEFRTRSTEKSNLDILTISSKPIVFTSVYFPSNKQLQVTKKDVQIHPLLDNYEIEYTYQGVTVQLFTESHKTWTINRPLFPLCGTHQINVRLDQSVKPLGIKLSMLPEFLKNEQRATLDLNVEINPRVPSLRHEFRLVGTVDLINAPLVSMKVFPDTKSNLCFNLFSHVKHISGHLLATVYDWIEAGETIKDPLVFQTEVQYGLNEVYNQQHQDLVIKTTITKSYVQRVYEEYERTELKQSSCARCEQTVKSNEYPNVDCRRCLLKRSWPSRLENCIYFNGQKINYVPLQLIPTCPLSKFNLMYMEIPTRSIREDLLNDHELIQSSLNHVNISDDLIVFKTIHEIHPYYSEWQSAIYTEEMNYISNRMPLIPAFRRVDNLATRYITDIALDRVIKTPTRAICSLDVNHNLRTFDNSKLTVPKPQCEHLLVKDMTKENRFEITTNTTKDNRRIVTIKLPKNVIEIENTGKGDKFSIKVDSVVKPFILPFKCLYQWLLNPNKMLIKEINTKLVHARLVDITSPVNGSTNDKLCTIELPTIKITLTMVNNLVDVEAPLFYKNTLCGLCGDFNLDKVDEYLLPDQTIAPTLEKFIQAYTDHECLAKDFQIV